jgi:hypothetical protein
VGREHRGQAESSEQRQQTRADAKRIVKRSQSQLCMIMSKLNDIIYCVEQFEIMHFNEHASVQVAQDLTSRYTIKNGFFRIITIIKYFLIY